MSAVQTMYRLFLENAFVSRSPSHLVLLSRTITGISEFVVEL